MSTLVRGERPSLTDWEKRLRLAAGSIALMSVGFAVAYLAMGTLDEAEFPFTANSIAKDALLAALGWLTVADVRRWGPITVPLIIFVHVVLALALAVTALWGRAHGIDHTLLISSPDAGWIHLGWAVSDVLVVTVLGVVNHMALRSRYDLRYLTPAGFRALVAMAEVLVPSENREIAPAEVAKSVDTYLAGFRAADKWKIRLGLIVLAYRPLPLRPPLAVMSVDARRRWVQERFLDEVAFRIVPRRLDYALIRIAQQFCFFGYYGDARAASKVGYRPFSQLPGTPEKIARVARPHRRVTCLHAGDVPGKHLSADVVIVGTGAGGATLAYELARRGREVLMLERGAHVDPSEFTENEATQLSSLYADGALELSTDFYFRVAQGMCVGGSTVVNNAVCFDLPDHVLDRWLDPGGLNAGLDPERLRAAFRHVRDFVGVRDVGPSDSLNPGAARLLAGLTGRAGWDFSLAQANIDGCVGCGYCNMGCAYGKKLSALDWTLPRAQRDFPDAVRILADCRVESVLMRGSRASGVAARLADGTRLTVHSDTVVLSAGAIASSTILQRSQLGGGRAGRRLAFNVGSPVTLDFADEIHSERGLQITHYLLPRDGASDGDGLALETWFNPVVAQALFMPGWFEEHASNMRRYAHMTCLGVVIGTESNGSVRESRFTGVNIDYTPSPRDFGRLKDGVRLAAEIGLEAGALRALPSTFRMLEIRDKGDLGRIGEEIRDDHDLSVNSSHPQGGNPMSLDALQGVVDSSFRVYGTTNVHVCDASVFPSSITVNPQLTVMAMAAYAADEIGGTAPTEVGPSRVGAPAAG